MLCSDEIEYINLRQQRCTFLVHSKKVYWLSLGGKKGVDVLDEEVHAAYC